MEESFGYRYNPNYVPEPKFVPGYGGYLPGSSNKFGTTYGNLSHVILRNRPEVAQRLASLKKPAKVGSTSPLDCTCKQGVETHKGGIIANKETMFIPEHVCPGYTDCDSILCIGCLTLKKKGLPVDSCCHKVLRSLGCCQDPYTVPDDLTEDPFPGPPTQILDHTQEKRRAENGMWKRYPKDYSIKTLHRWM